MLLCPFSRSLHSPTLNLHHHWEDSGSKPLATDRTIFHLSIQLINIGRLVISFHMFNQHPGSSIVLTKKNQRKTEQRFLDGIGSMVKCHPRCSFHNVQISHCCIFFGALWQDFEITLNADTGPLPSTVTDFPLGSCNPSSGVAAPVQFEKPLICGAPIGIASL